MPSNEATAAAAQFHCAAIGLRLFGQSIDESTTDCRRVTQAALQRSIFRHKISAEHMSTNITRTAAFLVALLIPLAGCQVLYDSLVADKEYECEKLVSQTQVRECKQKVRDQLANYRRDQSGQASSKGKAEKDGLCYVKGATGEKVCPN